MKKFEVPEFYRSPLLSKLKSVRSAADKLKKDYTPYCLDFGNIQFYIARHFGFCYGVENAIEIAFKTVEENPGKRIFLLSEMIHNPQVNKDLVANGVQFILDTEGNSITPWDTITANDIVIIPAFGTTLETEDLLKSKGIDPKKYNTTCPFVEKVWKRSEQIAKENFAIIIHGKPTHEETKATFSHSANNTPSLVIKNIEEANILANIITGEIPINNFDTYFKNRYSADFNPELHLNKLGVVNQTTMLAEETQTIAEIVKQALIIKNNNNAEVKSYFADTRDTLCYATNDNQTAIKGMLETPADLAIIIGGYNSSNTSHLVELCEEVLPTYFIKDSNNIRNENNVERYHFRTNELEQCSTFLPDKEVIKILISSGASCPDAIVESVIDKIVLFKNCSITKEELLGKL
jgi:4-hydroxy-3-methylbut-2-en-1-yl diphosphate reductase